MSDPRPRFRLPSRVQRAALGVAVAVAVALVVAVELGLRGLGGLAGGWQGLRAGVSTGAGPVVVMVGDSVTQGVPGPREEGWPTAFSERSGARVINLGAAGRGVDWIVADLDRRAPALPPDVVAVYAMVGPNDCAYLEDLASIHLPEAPTGLAAVRARLRKLALYRVLLQVVARARPTPGEVTGAVQPPPRGSKQSAHCREKVSSGIEALAARARRFDSELVVVAYPVPVRKDSPGLRVNRFVDSLLGDAAERGGHRFIDTRPCFENAPLTDWQQDGVHLTRSGYARLGRCVAEQ